MTKQQQEEQAWLEFISYRMNDDDYLRELMQAHKEIQLKSIRELRATFIKKAGPGANKYFRKYFGFINESEIKPLHY